MLAKMDGTAKGGAVFGIREALPIPVKYIGVGEGLSDIAPFEPEAFVDAILTFDNLIGTK
jgi:fused signal recognition particle receptor